VLTGRGDGSAQLWETATGRRLRHVSVNQDIETAILDPRGRVVDREG
jgi:hypothetical protein